MTKEELERLELLEDAVYVLLACAPPSSIGEPSGFSRFRTGYEKRRKTASRADSEARLAAVRRDLGGSGA